MDVSAGVATIVVVQEGLALRVARSHTVKHRMDQSSGLVRESRYR